MSGILVCFYELVEFWDSEFFDKNVDCCVFLNRMILKIVVFIISNVGEGFVFMY